MEDREKLMMDMISKHSGDNFLTEVALPGVRPGSVRDEDIAAVQKETERQDW